MARTNQLVHGKALTTHVADNTLGTVKAWSEAPTRGVVTDFGALEEGKLETEEKNLKKIKSVLQMSPEGRTEGQAQKKSGQRGHQRGPERQKRLRSRDPRNDSVYPAKGYQEVP